jgi:hypothetical protein
MAHVCWGCIFARLNGKSAHNGTFPDQSVWYGDSMKKSDLTAKQKLFVPYPIVLRVPASIARCTQGLDGATKLIPSGNISRCKP